MKNISTENTAPTASATSPAPYAPRPLARALKRLIITLLLLLIGTILLWAWYVRERIADLQLEDTVKTEVSRVENKLDEHGSAIESRLDRIEGKLDRLLFLLEPRLPDGMSQVE